MNNSGLECDLDLNRWFFCGHPSLSRKVGGIKVPKNENTTVIAIQIHVGTLIDLSAK